MTEDKKEVIHIYMRRGCPYCMKVEEHIERMKDGEMKKLVEKYYAGEDFSTEDFKNKYEGATFPRAYHRKKDGSVDAIKDSDEIVEYLK